MSGQNAGEDLALSLSASRASKIQKTASIALVIWGLTVTLLRTLRLPNEWAQAHWLISYRFGFVKRGLPGTLLDLVGFFPTERSLETTIIVISCTLLFIFVLLHISMLLQIASAASWKLPGILITILLATSAYYVMLAHLNGYYDIMIGIIAVCSLWLIRKRVWLVVAALQVVAMLIHESYLLVGFPIVAFNIYVLWRRGEIKIQRWIPTLVLPVLVLITLTAIQQTRSPAEFDAALENYLGVFSFIEGDTADLVAKSFARSFFEHYARQHENFPGRILGADYWRTYIPILLVGFLYFFRYMRITRSSLERVLTVSVTLLPLSMHVVAWDTSRIWSYTIFHVILIIWIFSPLQRDDPLEAGPDTLVLFMIAYILNLTRTPTLLDLEVDHFSIFQRWLLLSPILVLVFALPDTSRLMRARQNWLIPLGAGAVAVLALAVDLVAGNGSLWFRLVLGAYVLLLPLSALMLKSAYRVQT